MKNLENKDYLFSKLSEKTRKLNEVFLDTSWQEVDFDCQNFKNGINIDDENLTDKQNEFIKLIIENIPEWKRLLSCKQHNIHDYCLDIHTLSVLKKLQEFENFKKLKNYDKLVLLYAALLHDIEKNEKEVDPEHPKKGAEKSSSILFRLGFSED
ncbi:MAG: hypothetical protein KAQ92_05780, partial [Candidatus Aenigmarchaeota archaeon]|nr:hypothetical protein [Candidatus Aenigmarchaeota archaeon]